MTTRAATTTRTRTDDRAGGGGATVRWGVVRHVGAEGTWAQEVRYVDDDDPVGGGVEAVGGLFRIYPIPGGVHTSFFPFVVELRTQSNRVITNDTEYDAAIAEDSSDPLVPGELTTENLLPVRLYAMGSAWIGEPALKMLPSVVVVNPSNILPGGQG